MQHTDITPQIRRRMARWSLFASLLAVVVIMLGAWTRLVDAGLGCPDWPGCYGFLSVPQTEQHIAIANGRFPETPVEVAKGWPEMIHRYAAGTLGLVVFGLAGFAVRHRQKAIPLRLPLCIAGFVVLQAAFGMWTVTLKLWPQVVALHLLGGFTTLSLLVLLTLRLRRSGAAGQPVAPEVTGPLRRWVWAGLVLVILQISLGAWTAANYAAVACPELPTCQGEWWPAGMDFRHGFDVFQQVGPNYLGGRLTADGRVAIHMSHRVGALLVAGYFMFLLYLLWRHLGRTGHARPVLLLGGVLAAQLALGMANVYWQFPLAVAVAHNAMGAALLLAVINVLWRLQPLRATATAKATSVTTTNEVTA